MITQVSFVSIPVADQQRALAFYTEKLGFEVTTNEPMGEGGLRWIELRPAPGAQTRIVLFTPEGQEDRIGTFATASFAADDVRKTYEELKGRGVEFVHPPSDEPWGVMAQFKDSEGNTLLVASGT